MLIPSTPRPLGITSANARASKRPQSTGPKDSARPGFPTKGVKMGGGQREVQSQPGALFLSRRAQPLPRGQDGTELGQTPPALCR